MPLLNMQGLIESIIANMYPVSDKLIAVNGNKRLLTNIKSQNDHVLSILKASTLNHDLECISISSVNLLYDLHVLHKYPKLKAVKFIAPFQVMLPFATTEDDKLVFPQVTAVIIDVDNNPCINDVLPVNQMFPNLDVLVLMSKWVTGVKVCKRNWYLKEIRCNTLVVMGKSDL